MSVELIVEVLKHAPATLNPTERLTLVVIAESCRADTRLTYYRDGWDASEVARRVGVTPESLTKVLRSLARKGCEVRVPHAVKEGKPILAFKGKQTTFKLPLFAAQRPDDSPLFAQNEEAKDWTSVRERLDESPGLGAQSLDESPPLLLKDLPSKNTSSLSPQDPHDAAAVVPQPRSRERGEVSEDQTSTPMSVEHRLIAKRGVTGDSISYVEGWIESSLSINGIGWWITADRNGTLDAHIADAIKAEASDPNPAPSTPCLRCDGQGQDWCGDYFTTNPCLACHGSGEALESGDRRCPIHKHEPVACRLCRMDRQTSPSYIEQVNHQRRSNERGDFKRSVGAMRAEQGLRVAAELDRQYPPRRPNQHVPHLDREDIGAYKTSKLYSD